MARLWVAEDKTSRYAGQRMGIYGAELQGHFEAPRGDSLRQNGRPVIFGIASWTRARIAARRTVWYWLPLFFFAGLACPRYVHAQSSVPSAPAQTSEEKKSAEQGDGANSRLRGKKLVLKDGTIHAVRSWERSGNRVRYFSTERLTWEEIPADMIDWEATKKAEAATTKEQEALLEKVHAREAAEKAQPLDIDASLPIAPGVFLPPGEGLFAIDGKMVTPLDQVTTETKLDKKRQFEKIFVPIPIVPTRHRVQIPGPRAVSRITTALPEFYLREAPPDPDHPSPIRKSSRPGESGPELELMRATVKSGTRQIEILDTNIVGQQSAQRKTISLQRWEVAKGVYRFTLSEQLAAGEYAIAEMLPEGMNVYVWDFGVDLGPAAGSKNKPSSPKATKPAGSKP